MPGADERGGRFGAVLAVRTVDAVPDAHLSGEKQILVGVPDEDVGREGIGRPADAGLVAQVLPTGRQFTGPGGAARARARYGAALG